MVIDARIKWSSGLTNVEVRSTSHLLRRSGLNYFSIMPGSTDICVVYNQTTHSGKNCLTCQTCSRRWNVYYLENTHEEISIRLSITGVPYDESSEEW